MGLERFHGESAPNAEMKCLCTIVVDVSGTMESCIDILNDSLRKFFKDIENGNGVPETTKEQLEICIIAFDQDVMFKRNPCLLEQNSPHLSFFCFFCSSAAASVRSDPSGT